MLYIVQQVQNNVAFLYIAKLPGDMFVNGIIFGCGEILSMVFSCFLMGRLLDVTAFRVVYALGVIGYTLLMCFPDSAWLPYFGSLLLIMSIGGWLNIQLVILEMRVPPKNVASVQIIIRTIAIGTAISAPTISNLDGVWPLLTMAAFAFFAFLLTFMLPPPGLHLA